MRCAACKRPIFTVPTVTIQSKGTRSFFGPVCARRMGLTPTAVKQALRAVVTHGRRQRPNNLQLDLFKQPENQEATTA